jgi:hypothetical protein
MSDFAFKVNIVAYKSGPLKRMLHGKSFQPSLRGPAPPKSD